MLVKCNTLSTNRTKRNSYNYGIVTSLLMGLLWDCYFPKMRTPIRFLVQSFFETVHYCDMSGKIHISQSVSQSVIVLTFRGVYYVYTIYVCSDLLCFEGYLGNFSCFI